MTWNALFLLILYTHARRVHVFVCGDRFAHKVYGELKCEQLYDGRMVQGSSK